jgi:hypothetical protein
MCALRLKSGAIKTKPARQGFERQSAEADFVFVAAIFNRQVFLQEVYWSLVIGKNFRDIYSALSNSMTLTNHPMTAEETSKR